MRRSRPQNDFIWRRSQWLYDQHRNLARRGNRRSRSIREGATGHDDQPLLNLAEGESTGRRIGQAWAVRRDTLNCEVGTSGELSQARVINITAIGFDDNQLFLRCQCDGGSRINA